MTHHFPDYFRNPPASVLGSYADPVLPRFTNDEDVLAALVNWTALGRVLLGESVARINFYTSDAADAAVTVVAGALDEIEMALRGAV